VAIKFGYSCTSKALRKPLRLPVLFTMLALSVVLGCAGVFTDAGFGYKTALADEPIQNVVNTRQQPDSSFIYETSIATLAAADSVFENQTVQVTGEVVGDAIRAGIGSEYYWVTLTALDSKDDSTVVVYLSQTALANIDTYGAYAKKGTTLQVSGTFHLVCSEHQGVSDIHASSVSVVSEGAKTPDAFVVQKFIPGAIVIVVGLVLLVLYRIMRERRR